MTRKVITAKQSVNETEKKKREIVGSRIKALYNWIAEYRREEETTGKMTSLRNESLTHTALHLCQILLDFLLRNGDR